MYEYWGPGPALFDGGHSQKWSRAPQLAGMSPQGTDESTPKIPKLQSIIPTNRTGTAANSLIIWTHDVLKHEAYSTTRT